MADKTTITAEELRARLRYDPETGIFSSIVPWARWAGKAQLTGVIIGAGYVAIHVKGRRYYAHRLAWLYMTGEWPNEEIDHINRDRKDNRWANLRAATRSTNCQNSRGRGRYLKGTKFDPRCGSWLARIHVNKREIHLGSFRTEAEAHAAYVEAAKKYHGEFAVFD
jgi:hypothetical protein